MEPNKVILYGSFLSQPFRTCAAFCEAVNIPYEVIIVDVFKGEHREGKYKEMNPDMRIPFAQIDGIILAESHTILRYLANTRNVEDHWYPKDLYKRAQVEMYLDWHHLNIRFGSGGYLFRKTYLDKIGIISHEAVYKMHEDLIRQSLMTIEFQLGQHVYIANDEISIADISAVCEINQLYLINFDFSMYPKITNWIKRVMELKGMQVANEPLFKEIKRRKSKEKIKAKL